MIQKMMKLIKEESLFFIVAILCLITSLSVAPRVSAIDWKVIFSLLNLMLISLALEKYRLLDKIARSILKRFHTPASIGMAMIPTTALLAMLITNDVALITVVPLTIIVAKKAGYVPYKTIALETMAANIGSSLTPFGNPQNLYLYTAYKIEPASFLGMMLPFVLLGIGLLFLINLGSGRESLSFSIEDTALPDKKRVLLYIGAFLLVLLSILRYVDFRIVTLLNLGVFLLLDRDLFKKVDYFLLGTFVGFFIAIDNITRIGFIQTLAEKYLQTPHQVLILSSLFSQFLSNVPTAILFSGFTQLYKPLLLGVSLGGLGTMIASLANLISYKLYRKEFPSSAYTKFFYASNAVVFVLLFVFLAATLGA